MNTFYMSIYLHLLVHKIPDFTFYFFSNWTVWVLPLTFEGSLGVSYLYIVYMFY